MIIALPEGFPIPENARPGEPFEVVATIQPSDDGTFTLAALDGMEMPVEEAAVEEPVVEEQEEMAEPGIRLPFE